MLGKIEDCASQKCPLKEALVDPVWGGLGGADLLEEAGQVQAHPRCRGPALDPLSQARMDALSCFLERGYLVSGGA